MAKIPVGKTIRFAYEFTFGHLGAIIALIWLPTLLLVSLTLLPRVLGMPTPGEANIAASAAAGQALWGIFSGISSLLLSMMAYQAVAELALGLRMPGANFYFSLDRPVWRLLGIVLLFLLLVFVFILIFVGGVALAAWLASTALGKQVGEIAAGVGMFIAAGLAFLIVFRMGFLIVPVTVAEGKIDLGRGWTLTHGNFWRIFAVVMAVMLPLTVISVTGIIFILGKDLSVLLALLPDISPQGQAARFALIQRHMPMLIGLNLLLMPFNVGLVISMSTFAYRALTPPTDVFA